MTVTAAKMPPTTIHSVPRERRRAGWFRTKFGSGSWFVIGPFYTGAINPAPITSGFIPAPQPPRTEGFSTGTARSLAGDPQDGHTVVRRMRRRRARGTR
ncbi:hypothetical protein GCM10022256_01130 [Frondihabitans peucedani]|uniref:Uncharacterized protein n=1 Tax=Frondihabitans peucedani TaxID=598626 RepID=A0ABP8DX52_9MICO